MQPTPRYLNAREAADRLGVSVATLYAYVSRGLLRSEAGEGPSRARRYPVEDVKALCTRREARRDPGHAAQGALSYGMPVLESAITLIQDGGLYYRGYDALRLARECTVEEVASLLWLGRLDDGALFARPAQAAPAAPLEVALNPIECYQALLAQAGASDLAALLTAPEAMAATGARILDLLAGVTAGRPVTTSIVHTLQEAWAPGQTEVAGLLSAALVLCADHELNVSAFAARCVASAGATPYAVVIAGLAALQGHRHGGHTERVGTFLREAEGGVTAAVAGYLRQGMAIPGFGHPLYPDGDPRARLLLGMVEARDPAAAAVVLARQVCESVEAVAGLQPTVDFALEVLARTLALPPRAALSLFALGRTAGWVGHAMEQVATGQLIRPRAAYTGVTVAIPANYHKESV